MAIKLEVKNLYKIFGEHPQRAFKYIEKGLSKEQILDKTGLSLGVKNASLAIEEGEIFVIMGLSGSGKSTMVRLLNRLIEPTRGQVLIDGVDIAKISDAELREVRRKKIAMVFQSFALMPHMTVLDNAAFGMELAGIPTQQRQQKALEALRQGRVDAAFVSSTAIDEAVRRGTLRMDEIHVLWRSQPIPYDPFVIRTPLCPALQEQIRKVFLGHTQRLQPMLQELGMTGFVPVTAENYREIRQLYP